MARPSSSNVNWSQSSLFWCLGDTECSVSPNASSSRSLISVESSSSYFNFDSMVNRVSTNFAMILSNFVYRNDFFDTKIRAHLWFIQLHFCQFPLGSIDELTQTCSPKNFNSEATIQIVTCSQIATTDKITIYKLDKYFWNIELDVTN